MTSLLSGERVPKSHQRIEVCGELDELASVLGALCASLPRRLSKSVEEIRQIQAELLHIGAWLATTPGSPALALLRAPSAAPLLALEQAVESMEKELSPLQGFILPGGDPSAAWAHVARTVARRAERRAEALAREGPLEEATDSILAFLNRLSTYLFVLARYCNREHSIPDTLWNA
jgi:cob(I)alamin adenosyltransferase